MANLNISTLIAMLIALILVSAFFSASETGMMALNRYRLRHMMRKGQVAAVRVARLLERPDRLLGLILIGNTFANIVASSVATVIAAHYFGDFGVIMTTLGLTFVVLVFAETMPKTWAALNPQAVAFPASILLRVLLVIFYPIVFVVNGFANTFLRVFRVRVRDHRVEHLSIDELRTIVLEASGKVATPHQQMLLRILELEAATVDDVMVPRNEIQGIDVTDPLDVIIEQLTVSDHQYLPVYREDIDHVIGILSLRAVMPLLRREIRTLEPLLDLAEEIYYVPETTLLNHQLLNFQQENKSIGLVVDEYGDIQGLITVQDILEEIVGQFATDAADTEKMLEKQKDGSYLVNGAMSIRDLNRMTEWNFPTDGPRTVSGLIIEYLEMIPLSSVGLRIAGYPMEVVKTSENKIQLVRVFPNYFR